MKSLLVFLPVLFLPASLASATDFYVDKDATGSGNGLSWQDAWQNFSAIKWSSINPGDTIYLSGGLVSKVYNESLSGVYGLLNVKASGTKGMPITIRIGQDSGHNGIATITNINGTGISIFSRAFVTIDGDYNNSSHLRIRNCGKFGIVMAGSYHHVILRYLDVGNNGDAPLEDGINANNDADKENESLLLEIDHCDIHDNRQDQVHIVGTRGPQDYGRVKIHDNIIHGLHDDGIECGIRGLDYYNNIMHTFNGHLSAGDHPDGVADMAGNLRLYNSTFYNLQKEGDVFGNIIYPGVYSTEPKDECCMLIHNNLVFNNATPVPGDSGHKGLEFSISTGTAKSLSDVLVASNTFVGMPSLALSFAFGGLNSSNISNIQILNNIILDSDRIGGGAAAAIGGVGNDFTVGSYGEDKDVIIDYNIVYASSSGSTNFVIKSDWSHGSYESAVLYYGIQSHISGKVNPMLDSRYMLSSSSPAKDSGLDLSYYFSDDLEGTSRPQGSAWDIGAYEYVPSLCIHKSDTNCDGCVDSSEINTFINRWYVSSEDVSIRELMEAIGWWKKGC